MKTLAEYQALTQEQQVEVYWLFCELMDLDHQDPQNWLLFFRNLLPQ